jgi:hypothetical protein
MDFRRGTVTCNGPEVDLASDVRLLLGTLEDLSVTAPRGSLMKVKLAPKSSDESRGLVNVDIDLGILALPAERVAGAKSVMERSRSLPRVGSEPVVLASAEAAGIESIKERRMSLPFRSWAAGRESPFSFAVVICLQIIMLLYLFSPMTDKFLGRADRSSLI